MKRGNKFIGLIGLVTIIFGGVTHLLVAYDPYQFVSTHLIGGLILLCAFFLRGGLDVLLSDQVKRAAGEGLGMTLYSGLFLGIIVLVNFVASRHDFLHYDSTEQKVFTLAKQTKDVLDKLQQPIRIRAFYLNGNVDPDTQDLLNRLARYSPKIQWNAVDPEKNQQLAKKLGINEERTLHFSYAQEELPRVSKITGHIDEQEIVNAILKLSRAGEKIVYYTKGHGEQDLTSSNPAGFLSLKEAIEGENLKIQELKLNEGDPIPADAAALVVLAPQRPFLPREESTIQSYLQSGGSALLFAEAHSGVEQVAKLASSFGIEVGNDIIIEPSKRPAAGPSLGVQPVISDFGHHPITKDFKQDVVLSTVCSVRKSSAPPASGTVTELAWTSDGSWAEKNTELVFGDDPQAQLEDGDIKGPVSVAAAYEAPPTNAAHRTRIVVIGDTDFVANVNISWFFNRDFVLNSLNWVVGEEEGVTLRAKTLRNSVQPITAQQFSMIFFFGAILLPELFLLLGLSIWWFRRA